jgi:regulator of telomere elongation helicase 1
MDRPPLNSSNPATRGLLSKSEASPTYFGIQVPFPFQPYPVQERYMQEVIETLMTVGQNALLESPTGTGKTLCLLSATLAWQQQQQGNSRPKIFYASRTHAQLSQVSKELRKTAFPSLGVTAVSLGSRDHLCVHPVNRKSNGNSLVSRCKVEVEAKTCGYYNALMQTRGTSVSAPRTVMDIEEIRSYGNRSRLCSYYMAREVAKFCDMVFIPYNYLFDEEALHSLEVEISGSVVIVDEAHNMERVCEEVASLQIDSYDFCMAMDQVREAKLLVDPVGGGDSMEMNAVKLVEAVFTRVTASVEQSIQDKAEDVPLTYSKLMDMMSEKKIEKQHAAGILKAVDLVEKILMKARGGEAISADQQQKSKAAVSVRRVAKLFSILFEMCDSAEEFSRHFRAFIQPHATRDLTLSGKSTYALMIWCFSPALAVRTLVTKKKIRNLIVTSGTLAPLSEFAKSLGVPFDVQLVNNHVIDPKRQLLSGIVAIGPNKIPLNASFKDRDNLNYLSELGHVLTAVSQRVPEGVLVAFASYAQMDRVISHLHGTGIMGSLGKRIFQEPKDSAEVSKLMREFGEACTRESGAVLFCVARGKLSEGVDFSDSQCRAVVMVGIPFANAKDKRVAMKKEFLEAQMVRSGESWYRVDAMRAVNQTIGRVIRHRNDFGAILLCDERFSRMKSDLPSWTRDCTSTFFDFSALEQDLERFFAFHAGSSSNSGTVGLKRQHSAVDELLDRAMENVKLPRYINGEIPRAVRETLNISSSGGYILQCKPHEIGNPLIRRDSADPPPQPQRSKRELKVEFQEQARNRLSFSEYELFKSTLVEFIAVSGKVNHATTDFSTYYKTFKRILSPYDNLINLFLGILNASQVSAFHNATSI